MEVALITDTTSEQYSISFWNYQNGIKLKSYKTGISGKNGVGIIGNDFILVSQHEKQLIHIYDAKKEYLVKKIVCPGKVTALVISPCNRYCIVALVEKIYIWQICTGNLINILSKHYQRITSIKFSVDGSFLISTGDDNLVLIWNFVNVLQPKDELSSDNICDQPVHTISNHSMPVTSCFVGVTGNRSYVATSSLDQTCKIFSLTSGKMLCSIVFDQACTVVAMDRTETRLFVGTGHGYIYVINCIEQKAGIDNHASNDTPNFKAHSKEVSCLSLSLDDTKLISGSKDTTVKVWHINSRQCLKTITFQGEITNALILMYPDFLNEKFKSDFSKFEFPNFKRNIFTPVEHIAAWNDTENTDDSQYYPLLLEDILQDEDTFVDNQCSSFNAVLKQCMLEQTSTSESLKTATRSELVSRINTLEAMAQDFYKFACEHVLKKPSNTIADDITETS